MARLKPWYQVVTPREDLRENRPLDASEFAVHLDHIRLGRAHADYIEPKRFFERTFFTQSLLDLSSQVVRRLSGVAVETSAVFNMATQFGGGKTHALTALYHLAKGGDESKNWRGVDAILTKAQASCPRCNREFGQAEKDLLIRLILCVDPKAEAAAGLASKAMRSLGIDVQGLPEKERFHREAVRKKITADMIPRANLVGRLGAIPVRNGLLPRAASRSQT